MNWSENNEPISIRYYDFLEGMQDEQLSETNSGLADRRSIGALALAVRAPVMYRCAEAFSHCGACTSIAELLGRVMPILVQVSTPTVQYYCTVGDNGCSGTFKNLYRSGF